MGHVIWPWLDALDSMHAPRHRAARAVQELHVRLEDEAPSDELVEEVAERWGVAEEAVREAWGRGAD